MGYDPVTNGEHDDMMRDQRTALNSIERSLKRANGLAGIKELHDMGALSDEDYQEVLMFILEKEGYTGIKEKLIKKEVKA